MLNFPHVLLLFIYFSNEIWNISGCNLPLLEDPKICLISSSIYYFPIDLMFNGGYLYLPNSLEIPKNILVSDLEYGKKNKFEFFISPLSCTSSTSLCDGSEENPYDNIINAFYQARNLTLPYFDSEIIFYLLSDMLADEKF